ncbi:hypothetical protein M5689_021305 [Euphorbia peplus]|nr:hypothetical protein M5689_021305 [Euphorbia peplus]
MYYSTQYPQSSQRIIWAPNPHAATNNNHYHYPVTVNHAKTSTVVLTAEQIRQVFMQFDLNGDKVLSRDEIRQAFNYLGAVFPRFRALRAMSRADSNNDGVIDMSELDELVQYAYSLGYNIN